MKKLIVIAALTLFNQTFAQESEQTTTASENTSQSQTAAPKPIPLMVG